MENERFAFITAFELSVRESPSKFSDRLLILPENSIVEILEESETSETIDGITAKWRKIKSKPDEGWIFGGYAADFTKYEMSRVDDARWKKLQNPLCG